jgi:predicted Co/Zn/Cd cation transporter (cation efflux family)
VTRLTASSRSGALLSSSISIVLDGLFFVIDVAMGVVGLWIARLVTREANRRFQYGYATRPATASRAN